MLPILNLRILSGKGDGICCRIVHGLLAGSPLPAPADNNTPDGDNLGNILFSSFHCHVIGLQDHTLLLRPHVPHIMRYAQTIVVIELV